MQHFLSTVDWTREQLDGLLSLAAELKQQPIRDDLRGKSIEIGRASCRERVLFAV